MEHSQLDQIKEEHLSLNDTMINVLSITSKWTKFLSILGFVMCGFLALFGFFYVSVMTSFSKLSNQAFPVNDQLEKMSGVFIVIYLIVAVIYFFPAYYLFQFSTKLQNALKSYDNEILESAFTYLKSHYKFIGILVIIGLSFYTLVFLIAGLSILATS